MIIAFCVIAFASSGVHGTITTNPILPENKLASNYVGLMLSTQFVLQSSYTGCSWVAQSIGGEIIFHNIARSCFNSSSTLAEVQCVEDNGITRTTLHVTSALNSMSEEFSVRCTVINMAPVTIAARTITIADCSMSPPLRVISASATYNASGTFSCASDGTLYYSNGTQPISTQTTCLATTEWSGQDRLECWKAPSSVNIDGDFTVLEGNEISLACAYISGVPEEHNVTFNVNDQEFPGQNYRQTLNRNDNKKPVYCQANNRFTEIASQNASNGRSTPHLFNVLYAPFTNTSNECYISSEALQYNPECDVVFYSNPNATFVSVTLADSSTDLNSFKNPIIIDGSSSKHSFKFIDYKATNISSSTQYYLTVHVSEVPPFNHTIPFIVNVITPTTTIATAVAMPCGNVTTIIVIVVVLVTVLTTALIVVTVLLWRLRRKHSSMSLKQQGKDKESEFQMQWRTQQKTTGIEDPNNYLVLDDQSRAVYEKIDGCKNLNESTSASNQHEEENAYLKPSITPYVNFQVEQKSSNASGYQNVRTENERSAEILESTKPESDYEMMNAQIVEKE